MYAFIDRPISSLGRGSRFVLWAMRSWTRAVHSGTCPPGTLATAFLRHHAIDALPPFHRLMGELNLRARDRIALAELGCPVVSEWEAMLLQLWVDARAEPFRARAMLDAVVEEEAVAPCFEALITAATRITAAGLPILVH